MGSIPIVSTKNHQVTASRRDLVVGPKGPHSAKSPRDPVGIRWDGLVRGRTRWDSTSRDGRSVEVVEAEREGLVEFGEEVAVAVEGDGDAAVAEAFLDGFGVGAEGDA